MEIFYVNSIIQPSGYHEVHNSNCQKLPGLFNRKCLGHQPSKQVAIKEAKKIFQKVYPCVFCLNETDKNKTK